MLELQLFFTIRTRISRLHFATLTCGVFLPTAVLINWSQSAFLYLICILECATYCIMQLGSASNYCETRFTQLMRWHRPKCTRRCDGEMSQWSVPLFLSSSIHFMLHRDSLLQMWDTSRTGPNCPLPWQFGFHLWMYKAGEQDSHFVCITCSSAGEKLPASQQWGTLPADLAESSWTPENFSFQI